MTEKTSRIQVPVLREHHENCQNAHSTSALIRAANASRLTKPEGTSYVRPSVTTAKLESAFLRRGLRADQIRGIMRLKVRISG